VNRLQKFTTIKAGFSWIDWDLEDHPGVVVVAQKLNEALERAVNGGENAEGTRLAMTDEFQKYEKFGSNEAGPHAHLDEILTDIFGD
jgi:hypothetical protein